MKQQMILKIGADTDFESMPDNLKAAIRQAAVEWPQRQMVGTEVVNGKMLILIMTVLSRQDLESWIVDGWPSYDPSTGESTLIDFGLDWEVIATEGEQVDQSLILPYILPDVDEEGNETPVADLTGRLQTYAGHKWTH